LVQLQYSAMTDRRAWLILACVALLYSGVHFLRSGVVIPLSEPNLGQVGEEALPLRIHLDTGQRLTTNNPRQYGPAFLLVMHPFMRWAAGDERRLSYGLYALSIAMYAASFGFTIATLWPFVPAQRRVHALVLLLVLWLNFAPAYAILAVKNVEIWELFLLSAALYWLVRGDRALAGTSVALAALIKLLPFIYFYYFLLRDRRAFLYACAAVVATVLVAQAFYGAEVGLLYLPRVFQTATSNDTWGLTWHENISIKGMIVKMLGHLEGMWDPATANLAMGGSGHAIVIDGYRLAIAQTIGLELQFLGGVWLTWMILRRRGAEAKAAQTVVFEWSLVSVMMLVLSPQTAFEYTVLALGAFSYVLVRLVAAGRDAGALAWASFAGAVFLIANILPRTVVARLLLIERINRMTTYGQLSPTEGFQYYGFPLLGLLLLVVSLCSSRIGRPAVHA
jgi:hypothetical protein